MTSLMIYYEKLKFSNITINSFLYVRTQMEEVVDMGMELRKTFIVHSIYLNHVVVLQPSNTTTSFTRPTIFAEHMNKCSQQTTATLLLSSMLVSTMFAGANARSGPIMALKIAMVKFIMAI